MATRVSKLSRTLASVLAALPNPPIPSTRDLLARPHDERREGGVASAVPGRSVTATPIIDYARDSGEFVPVEKLCGGAWDSMRGV